MIALWLKPRRNTRDGPVPWAAVASSRKRARRSRLATISTVSERMGMFIQKRMDDESLAKVQRLKPLAAKLGLTMAQLALAWVLRRHMVSSAIIGATRPEQVEENARASGVKLDADVLRRIDEVLA